MLEVARTGVAHAQSTDWRSELTEAQVAREGPSCPPRPLSARLPSRHSEAFRLWQQRAHLSLWTWFDGHDGHMVSCTYVIKAFQWNSVIVMNYVKSSSVGTARGTVSNVSMGKLEFKFLLFAQVFTAPLRSYTYLKIWIFRCYIFYRTFVFLMW